MKVENVSVNIERYIISKSSFYTTQSTVSESYQLIPGINKFIGDIDSGYWAISYYMSMSKKRKNFVLLEKPVVIINGNKSTEDVLYSISCYMDGSYPLFSSKRTVRTLIKRGLKKSKLNKTVDEICDLFELDNERSKRPISKTGNEKFRAMAAVGVSFGKEVFCFPWFSERLFSYYHNHLVYTLDVLNGLDKMVILPIGKTEDIF